MKQKNEYWLIVPVPQDAKPKVTPINYCGIDPGCKTFMTAFGNNGCTGYIHNETMLKKLDKKIQSLKDKRNKVKNHRVLKRKINKVEKRKAHLIDELHWKTVHKLLDNNDFIFYGDIKSHDIVSGGKIVH